MQKSTLIPLSLFCHTKQVNFDIGRCGNNSRRPNWRRERRGKAFCVIRWIWLLYLGQILIQSALWVMTLHYVSATTTVDLFLVWQLLSNHMEVHCLRIDGCKKRKIRNEWSFGMGNSIYNAVLLLESQYSTVIHILFTKFWYFTCFLNYYLLN